MPTELLRPVQENVDNQVKLWHKCVGRSAARAGLDQGLPLSLLRFVHIHGPLGPSQAGSDESAVGSR